MALDKKAASAVTRLIFSYRFLVSSIKGMRNGLLDEIPHRKLIRVVLIFKEEDAKKAISFLKSYNAEVHVRKAELTKDDEKILGQYSGKSGLKHH